MNVSVPSSARSAARPAVSSVTSAFISVGVGAGAPGPAAVVEQRGQPRLLRAAVAVVHDRRGLDRDRAVVVLGELAARGARRPRPAGPVAERRGRRPGRVDAEGVLGHEPAVGRAQADGAGVRPQALDHGGDRVHHVVVPRTAGEAQPAGDRERPVERRARARARRSAPRTGSTSRGRRGQVVDADAGELEARPARRAAWPATTRGRQRFDTNQWSWASVPAHGNTQRSAGTPSVAGPLDRATITAAPCSTALLEFMSFVYGNPTIRLSGPAVRISSAE